MWADPETKISLVNKIATLSVPTWSDKRIENIKLRKCFPTPCSHWQLASHRGWVNWVGHPLVERIWAHMIKANIGQEGGKHCCGCQQPLRCHYMRVGREYLEGSPRRTHSMSARRLGHMLSRPMSTTNPTYPPSLCNPFCLVHRPTYRVAIKLV